MIFDGGGFFIVVLQRDFAEGFFHLYFAEGFSHCCFAEGFSHCCFAEGFWRAVL